MGVFDYIAERKIREAINKGEFDHLEGFGKPVDNSEYFSVPAEDRIAFHILKNSGVVPEEIEIRKSIYLVSQEIKRTGDPDEVSVLQMKKQMLEDRLFILAENKRNR